MASTAGGRARRVVAAAACAALLAGCAADDPADPSSDPGTSTPSADASAGTPAASPGGDDQAGDSGDGSGDQAGDGGDQGGDAGADDPGDGASSDGTDDPPLEVPSPSPTDDGLPGLSPGPDLGDPLVGTPLPKQATARGRLVSGYPEALAPAPGSTVSASSVSPSGQRLQVTLTATSRRVPGQVLLAFRQRLRPLGFTEQKVSSAPGTQAAGFARGQDAVTLTVTRDGDGSSYTLLATLRAG